MCLYNNIIQQIIPNEKLIRNESPKVIFQQFMKSQKFFYLTFEKLLIISLAIYEIFYCLLFVD